MTDLKIVSSMILSDFLALIAEFEAVAATSLATIKDLRARLGQHDVNQVLPSANAVLKSTGLTVRATSHAGALEIQVYFNEKTGRDEFEVRQVSKHGNCVVLHQGVVGDSLTK